MAIISNTRVTMYPKYRLIYLSDGSYTIEEKKHWYSFWKVIHYFLNDCLLQAKCKLHELETKAYIKNI